MCMHVHAAACVCVCVRVRACVGVCGRFFVVVLLLFGGCIPVLVARGCCPLQPQLLAAFAA